MYYLLLCYVCLRKGGGPKVIKILGILYHNTGFGIVYVNNPLLPRSKYW